MKITKAQKEVIGTQAYIKLLGKELIPKQVKEYDYEANRQGCTINNYAFYRRHKLESVLIYVFFLLTYFSLGYIVGILI